ncbi:HAD hydrolase-like protein [Neiella marina]|uniref:phosphoglycolate phosphatase n=1 Tax=Neiella holothuriorum TaxID=2870530 RepID=A0ABS7EKF3_9GAMM|nr:HAD hydrolase-like protein [Neiella holothuriorum]MBW8192837.1 HAD hydrolase-like protein [Neiella holothuriorum]
MHLVMFDVDGTLTESYQYDQACYGATMKHITGLDVDTDWNNYTHVTDSAVTLEILQQHNLPSNMATEAECHFAIRLRTMHANQPGQFAPIKGAPRMLQQLKQADVGLAIATGCWRDSALIKLKNSGVAVDGIPMATASDALTRQDIMRTAEERAAQCYGINQFDSVIYIGDGTWDVRSSRELGWHFVGVGADIDNLRSLGVYHTLRDYSEPEKLWQILAEFGIQHQGMLA